MVRLATAFATAATVALAVSGSASAAPAHHSAHHPAQHSPRHRDAAPRGHGDRARHLAAIEGSIASVDQGAGTAVLNVGRGHSTRTVTLDLSSASVVLYAPHTRPAAGTLADVTAGDRVVAKLAVDGKSAKSDIAAGTPLPVAMLRDHGQPPAPGAEPAKVGGTVTAVSLPTVTITTGDGPAAHTITLDVSSATVLAGTPLAPADASAVAVGDRVGGLLSVSEAVAVADVTAGTPLPVARLYDIGPRSTIAPPTVPAPTPPAPFGHFGGHVTAIDGTQMSLTYGDGSSQTTVTLDLTNARMYGGQPIEPITAAAIHVGDIVWGKDAVTADVAAADAAAGTAIPVQELVDLGPLPLPGPAPAPTA